MEINDNLNIIIMNKKIITMLASDKISEIEEKVGKFFSEQTYSITQHEQIIASKIITSSKFETKTKIIIETKTKSFTHKSMQHLKDNIDLFNAKFEKLDEGQKIITAQRYKNYLIDQTIQNIGNKLDHWINQWQQYLTNGDNLVTTIKIIQIQFESIKVEFVKLIDYENIKAKSTYLQKNIQLPKSLQLLTALFAEFSELQDYFDSFDLRCLTLQQIDELKTMNSELLPYLIEIELLNEQNKKKIKRKRRKNKKNQNKTQPNPQIVTQQDTLENRNFNELMNSIDTMELNDKNRYDCRVSDDWLRKLEKQIAKMKCKIN